MPYEQTTIGVGQTQGSIEDLLGQRGVTDIRWTQTTALKVLEFSFPIRTKTEAWCSARSEQECEATGKMHPRRNRFKHAIYEIKTVLGVRIVLSWTDDQKEQRRLMRVLFWMLKSKFETIDTGLAVFEEEFLAHLTLGRGQRVYDAFRVMLDKKIAAGEDLSAGIGDTGLLALGAG